MLVSDRAVKFDALWRAVSDTPAPPLQLLMRWCLKFDDETIERTILKSGAKFRRIPIDAGASHRYANGLIQQIADERRTSHAPAA